MFSKGELMLYAGFGICLLGLLLLFFHLHAVKAHRNMTQQKADNLLGKTVATTRTTVKSERDTEVGVAVVVDVYRDDGKTLPLDDTPGHAHSVPPDYAMAQPDGDNTLPL